MPVLKCRYCGHELNWGVPCCPRCKKPYTIEFDLDDHSPSVNGVTPNGTSYCSECGSRLDHLTGNCSCCNVRGQNNSNFNDEPGRWPRRRRLFRNALLLVISIITLVGVVATYQLFDGWSRQKNVREEVIEGPIFRPTDISKITEDPRTGMLMESGTIMVVIHENVSRDQVSEVVADVNGQVVGGLEEIRVFEIAIQDEEPAAMHAAIESLEHKPIFQAVLPNYLPGIDKSTLIPDVPQWKWFFNEKKRWGQQEINMPQAWPISTGDIDNRWALISGSKKRIAIIDSGFDLTHPDLGDSVLTKINPVSWYELSKINHGTSVASVIGASAYNRLGMAGIMWQPELHCYQVASFKDILTALHHAYQKGIRVANISLGIDWRAMRGLSETEIESEIAKIRNKLKGSIEYVGRDNGISNSGMVIVSSAGNAPNRSADHNYPQGFAADYDHVISVGSIARDGSASALTSFGSSVSVVAPGEDIWMARKVYPIISNYHYNSGTSFASPMVAWVAGLLLTVNPELSPGEVKQIIMDTAVPHNFDRPLGSGVVDAYAAVRKAKELIADKEKPTPPEQDEEEDLPNNGLEHAPPDNNYSHLCETGEKQYHYDDGSEAGVFPYYQCTYYAAKEFQKIAPEPGVNWGPSGGASAWYKNAGSSGWVTTNDIKDSRLRTGSIIVWGNHVQIVRSVFANGIIVQGMNESWPRETVPIDPSHSTHKQQGFTIYTGYVYKYCIPFDEFDKYGSYFGNFQGYILPIRQGDMTQPPEAPVPVEPIPGPDPDFTVAVVILIDVSGSMNDYWVDGVKMDSAREAAIQMVDLIEAESNIEGRQYLAALVEFSFDADIIQPMTSNFDLLRHEVENLNAAGGTNIGDGLEKSFSALSEVPYERALVIMLSDGMTNRGRNPSQILEWLKSQSILYAPPPEIGLQASSYSYKERLLWSEYLLINSAQYATSLLQELGYESYLGIHEESSYALGRLPADLVFKFIGHANQDRLRFQDDHDNRTHLISGDIRRANLENLQLVVLTGCQTAGNIQNRNNILRSFVDAGARVGVGFSDKISILDATHWSNTFWDKLINDRLTVSEASLAGTWRGWPLWPSNKGVKRSHVVTYPAGIAHILTIDDMMPCLAATIVEGELSSPRVYTVGFGDPDDLDEELLRSIASATGGEYYYGRQSSDLANIFIRTQHLGTGTLQAEFEGIIHQGEELTAGSFNLNRGESELRVTLNWPGSFIDLQLVDPRGNTVALDYKDLVVWRKEQPAYIVISKPLPGEWTVKLYGEDIAEGNTDYYVIASTGDLITTAAKPLEFMIVLASFVLLALIAAPRIAGNSSLGRRLEQ